MLFPTNAVGRHVTTIRHSDASPSLGPVHERHEATGRAARLLGHYGLPQKNRAIR